MIKWISSDMDGIKAIFILEMHSNSGYNKECNSNYFYTDLFLKSK